MKVKLLKPIYLNSTYVLEGTILDAKLIDQKVIVEYKTCCSVGTRKLEADEFEFYKDDVADNVGTK